VIDGRAIYIGVLEENLEKVEY